jgi:hypothetical protein
MSSDAGGTGERRPGSPGGGRSAMSLLGFDALLALWNSAGGQRVAEMVRRPEALREFRAELEAQRSRTWPPDPALERLIALVEAALAAAAAPGGPGAGAARRPGTWRRA